MTLGFNFFSSFFFLSQFNVYLVVLFFVLGCLLGGFNGRGLQLKTKSFLAQSARGLFFLGFLLVGCSILSLLFVRGLELSVLSGALAFTAPSLRWLFFVCMFGLFIWGVLLASSPARLSFSLVEFFSGVFLLLQVWSWLPLQTNWLAVLLFLEVGALLVLLFSVHTHSMGFLGVASSCSLVESGRSLPFNFLKFFIFFLWLSVVATFFFFWALALAYTS
jgi:hypothetical protein